MSATTVQSFYIAYYGRPADPSGLDFWVGRVAAEGSFDSLVAAFGTSAEATELFADKTDTQKINAVYQSTFGRDADAEGLAFYSAGLADGTFSLYDISKRILDGATTGDDAAIVANKITVAQAFTAELASDPEAAAEYVGIAATTSAKALVSAVDATAASVTTATAQINVILGVTTSTLTTGVDTIAGTAGRDKISGGSTTLSTTDTLQAADQIDGGAGNDTLNLTLTKNFGGFTTGTGFLKNVETVNLTNSSLTATSFTAKAVEGVSTYNLSGPVSLSGINSLSTKVSLSNVATATSLSLGYADEVVTGSSDSASIGVSGLGTADATDAFASTVVTLTVPGVENITFNATGSASHLALGAASANKGLLVTGSAPIVLTTLGTSSNVKTYDGSAATGAQSVQFTNATNMTSVKTGAGADTIRAASGILRADATVDGGAGADTLRVNTAGNITSAWSLNDVETLRLDGTGNLVLAAGSASGLTTVFVNSDATGTSSITGLGAANIAVNLRAPASGTDGAATLTVENTGSIAVSPSLATGASSATALDIVIASKATSATLEVGSTSTYGTTGSTATFTATKATAVTVTGAGTVTLDGDASASADVNSLVIPAATSLTLNQTGSSKVWAIDVADGSATTPALADLTITAAGSITLTDDDTTALTNVERLTVSTDKAFTYTGDFAKLTALTLSGASDDSAVDLDNLGGSNAYGLTVTATGLKKGLNVEDLDVGSGQTISIDLTGLTATTSVALYDANFDALRVASDSGNAPATLSGAVTLNGKNSSSTVSLIVSDQIFAKTVNLDISGSSFGSNASIGGVAGTAEVSFDGAITGESVTIKTNSAPSKFDVSTINVKDSLVFHGPSTVSANQTSAVTVNALTGKSTALTVDLQGSLSKDEFTINGTTTQTSIVVTGDLKGDADAADKVTIDSSVSIAAATVGQTINVSGLADSTTSIIGSSGKDTITGSAGKDTIKGGLSADTITISSGGDDVVLLAGPQDTGEVTSITTSAGVTTSDIADWSATATKINAGSYVSTSNLDKVVGFATGDTIVTNARTGSTNLAELTALQTLGELIGVGRALTSSNTNLVVGTSVDVFIPGTYDAANNRFTFSSSGADTLFMFEQDGSVTKTNADFYGIVLVGYAAGATTDSITTGDGFTGLIGGALGS